MGPLPIPALMHDGLDDIRLFFLALSLLTGAIYFFMRTVDSNLRRTLIKTACVSALAVYVAISLPDGLAAQASYAGLLLVAGLVLSAAGDFFLANDREKQFVLGLGSFLIGHICYIACFALLITPESLSIANKLGGALFLLLFAAGEFAWLRPDLGKMTVPVAAYVSVIALMGAAAILAPFVGGWVVFGAIMFMISDSLIAAEKFKEPMPYIGPYMGQAIWGTYVLAQYLIAFGVLQELGYLAAG